MKNFAAGFLVCVLALTVVGWKAFDDAVIFKAPVAFSFGTATAGTTQTQAGATGLTKMYNKVTTGNASDGVSLPAGTLAQCVLIKNVSAVALKVYGDAADDDTIDGGSADASVTHAASDDAWYCTANGVAWTSF